MNHYSFVLYNVDNDALAVVVGGSADGRDALVMDRVSARERVTQRLQDWVLLKCHTTQCEGFEVFRFGVVHDHVRCLSSHVFLDLVQLGTVERLALSPYLGRYFGFTGRKGGDRWYLSNVALRCFSTLYIYHVNTMNRVD